MSEEPNSSMWTLSELIEELRELKNIHGDLPVVKEYDSFETTFWLEISKISGHRDRKTGQINFVQHKRVIIK